LPLETSAPSLAELLADELELRDVLIAAAHVDDEYAAECRMLGDALYYGGEPYWPPFAALAELRIVERRIHQLKELLHG
jgi:hypothetical protein